MVNQPLIMPSALLPVPKTHCYTHSYRTEFLYPSQSITHRPPTGYPRRSGRTTSRENSLSKKRRLTEDQERQRMDGLRILARIIARHYLAHPELYPQPVDADAQGQAGDGETAQREAAE